MSALNPQLPAFTIGYSCDADGNRASIIYPDASTAALGRNARGQLREVNLDSPPAAGSHDGHLLSIPGVGPILAAVIAAEPSRREASEIDFCEVKGQSPTERERGSQIDDIHRFSDASHLCAYAGLVPTTHARV
ncbi:MAG TPA: hypothetical protein VIT21_10550 [Chthoniobacterales bacterium]